MIMLLVKMIKKNFKLLLCIIKHQDMKTYDGVQVQLHAILKPALDGDRGEFSFTTRPLYSSGKSPCAPVDKNCLDATTEWSIHETIITVIMMGLIFDHENDASSGLSAQEWRCRR
jgi:hypothetical protein